MCCHEGVWSLQAGGHQRTLQQTKTLLERAISLSPSCADYTIEVRITKQEEIFSLTSLCPQLGHHCLIEGKLQEALQTYRRAFSIDEMSIPAMMGVLHCQLLMGKNTEAQQQLEFLNELQTSPSSQAVSSATVIMQLLLHFLLPIILLLLLLILLFVFILLFLLLST